MLRAVHIDWLHSSLENKMEHACVRVCVGIALSALAGRSKNVSLGSASVEYHTLMGHSTTLQFIVSFRTTQLLVVCSDLQVDTVATSVQ